MSASPRFWNWIAGRYARQPVADAAIYQRKLEITRGYLSPEARVLELGCGTGSTALAHAPHAGHVEATDFSPRMIEIAQAKAAQAGIDNVAFRCAAVDAVEPPEESLDAVLALNLLHLMPDWRDLPPRVLTWLKPGGVFVTSTICLGGIRGPLRVLLTLGAATGILPPVQFFTREDYESALRAAGFDLAEVWDPGPGKALFVVARKPGA